MVAGGTALASLYTGNSLERQTRSLVVAAVVVVRILPEEPQSERRTSQLLEPFVVLVEAAFDAAVAMVAVERNVHHHNQLAADPSAELPAAFLVVIQVAFLERALAASLAACTQLLTRDTHVAPVVLVMPCISLKDLLSMYQTMLQRNKVSSCFLLLTLPVSVKDTLRVLQKFALSLRRLKRKELGVNQISNLFLESYRLHRIMKSNVSLNTIH